MASKPYLINSVLRAAKLLECFSLEKPALTNSQLAKMLGVHKSTITRLVYSLEEAGFLRKDQKTSEYSLTYRLFRIGSVYINQIGFRTEARPLLSELASSIQETVHLAVLSDFEVFYIDKFEGAKSVGMMSRVGNKSPAYCTGVGKVLLAFLAEDDLNRYLNTVELKRYTSNTINNPEELKRHLQKIRQQGYTMDDSEHEADIKCAAAPLHDASGKVVASISIAGPRFRINRERMKKEILPAVVKTARSISAQLGYVERR
jgi:IclR family KDG regulon transcriptional repressor